MRVPCLANNNYFIAAPKLSHFGLLFYLKLLTFNTSGLKRDRWDALNQEQKERFAPVCPDFVVELRSDNHCLTRLQDKMREYRDNGATLGWLINLKTRQVEIYRPRQEVEVLQSPTTLSGEKVLPGFVLNLEAIW